MQNRPQHLQRYVWATLALLLSLGAVFAVYVYLEKQVERYTRVRLQSVLLAEEMRQSSDELTRMARNFVATGSVEYRDRYHKVLDIREGRAPRSTRVLAQVLADTSVQEVPAQINLLELMRRAGITAQEFDLLALAKTSSDQLAQTEFRAMEVVERHPTRRDLLEKARASLYDQDYQVAKATIMGAVNDFSLAVDERTQRELRTALLLELWVRALLVALGLGLLAVLLLAHRALLQVLGAPVDTLHQHITRLGQGHFESDIAVGGSDPGSVLAHLAQTQAQLRTMQEQGRASNAAREEALKEAQTLMQALDEHAIVSITDAAGTITYANEMFSRISGFRNEELVGQNHRIVKSTMQTDTFWVHMWKTVSSGYVWRDVVCNRGKDGQLYWVDTVIAPFFDQRGHITKYISIRHDLTAIKQAQQALEDERTRLTNLINGTRVGTWEINLQTNHATVNARWAAMLGYTLTEVGDQALDLWRQRAHPEDQKTAQELLRRHCQGETEVYEFEARIQRRQGDWMWVRSRGKLVSRSADGRPLWLYGMDVDITESKHTQETLEATTRRLQDHLNFLARAGRVAGIGRWQIDLDDWSVDWSEQSCHIMDVAPGYRPDFEEMLGFFALPVRDSVRSAFAVASETGKPWDVEVPVVTAMGRSVWVRCAAEAEYLQGKRTRLVGIFQDISQRRRLEEEIRAKNELMRSVLDHMPVGVSVMDNKLHLVESNTLFRQLLDLPDTLFSPSVVTFESIIRFNAQRGEYGPGDTDAKVRDIVARAKLAQPHQFQRARGNSTIEVRGAPMPNGGFVTTYADISDLKRAMDAAQDASRSKSQFVANMSHEIRTPMNAILGLLKLLQNTELNPRQLDYVGKTEGAAQSLLGLLNDILDFSKMEAGKLELDPQPCALDQLLRNLSVILSANVGTKPVEVLFDIDARVPRELVYDKLRLQQILINLAGNAIKFTAQGVVVLQIALQSLSKQRATLRFSVSDTGIGIAQDKLAHIFEDFSQAEGDTTRRFGGTGLGLSISRRLVSMMGGDLEVRSTPGKGSEFYFTVSLPVAPRAAALPAPASHELAQLRVLVVDDNEVARSVLAQMAQAWGWLVDTAASGEQGLQMLLSTANQSAALHHLDSRATAPAYDVILLDWSMPGGMDGWQTLSAMQASLGEATRKPVFIMVTAHGREGLTQRSLKEQSALGGFLVKPITASMLLDTVADARAGNPNVRTRPRCGTHQQHLQGMRILLAEDNLINQQVASELLRTEGAEVEIAGNGKIAVQALREGRVFDVVLMDLQMPEMDGFEATRAIRQQLALEHLPVIAMTANALHTDRDACLIAGMNDHVGKPFELQHLIKVLLQHVRRHPARPAPPVGTATTPSAAQAAPSQNATASLGSSSGLDMEQALDRIDGNTELMHHIVGSFIQESGTWCGQLDALLQQNERAQAARLMHTVKGLAGTVGATGLAAYAKALETTLKDPSATTDADTATDFQKQLEHACKLLKQCLSAWESTEPATEEPVAAASSEALLAHLQQLLPLLQQSDLQALECFALCPALPDTLPAQSVETLRQSIAEFDFPVAAQHCADLIAVLETQLA